MNGSVGRGLFDGLRASLRGDLFWEPYFGKLRKATTSRPRVHLAIFVEPYLSYLLDGRKTVDSRFSVRRTAPYGQVRAGDIVLVKQSGGPAVGVCHVSSDWF